MADVDRAGGHRRGVQHGWRWLFGPQTWFPDIASYGGVVLVMSLVLYPYVYLLARTAFYEQSASTVEAARALGLSASMVFWKLMLPLARPSIAAGLALALMETLGLSETMAFWKVMLPLARPSIAAGLALALMEALADFGTVGIYGYSTFTVAIYRVWFGLFNREAATELASILLCFTFGLLLLERLMRGRARFSQTEGSVRPLAPHVLAGWRAWVATGICGCVVTGAFLLPVAQLLYWTLSTLDGPEFDARYPTFLINTLTLAAVTASIAVVAAVVLAYGLRLSRSPSRAYPR